MSKARLQSLFRCAGREPAPEPPAEFAAAVLGAIRGAPGQKRLSVFDQLEAWFPRLAWATGLLIAACVLAELCLSAAGSPDLASGVARISEQWLFATQGF